MTKRPPGNFGKFLERLVELFRIKLENEFQSRARMMHVMMVEMNMKRSKSH